MLWESQQKRVETYYITKWGGNPGKEIYTTPWNIK
jgi:hypothetical protein